MDFVFFQCVNGNYTSSPYQAMEYEKISSEYNWGPSAFNTATDT